MSYYTIQITRKLQTLKYQKGYAFDSCIREHPADFSNKIIFFYEVRFDITFHVIMIKKLIE